MRTLVETKLMIKRIMSCRTTEHEILASYCLGIVNII
jgi:hypothetical protein